MTPVMADKKTAYADKYVVKFFDELKKCHGQMVKQMAAAINPPLLILMYWGNKAVISVPALM